MENFLVNVGSTNIATVNNEQARSDVQNVPQAAWKKAMKRFILIPIVLYWLALFALAVMLCTGIRIVARDMEKHGGLKGQLNELWNGRSPTPEPKQ